MAILATLGGLKLPILATFRLSNCCHKQLVTYLIEDIKEEEFKSGLNQSGGMLPQENFENRGVNICNFGEILLRLNIDHWIIQLWDQLNLSISQGFRYKPRGGGGGGGGK